MRFTRSARCGFTMIEAALAIALTAMAGSAILLGIHAALASATRDVEETVAAGMAQQLVDEIVGALYAAPGAGPYQTALGPNAQETGKPRERYDDIDDFDDLVISPAADPYGILLGEDDGLGGTRPAAFRAPNSYFRQWRQKVDVYYVNPTNFSQRLPGNNTSDYRCVEVTIEHNDDTRGWQPAANLRRIVTYLQRP